MQRRLIPKRLAGFVAGLALACASGGLATACGSDGGGDSSSSSSSPIVGTWKQTKAEERTGTSPWAVAHDAACRTDNTEEFAANGAWTLYDGTVQCGAGTGIGHGSWRVTAANTIVFTYDGVPGEYESTMISRRALCDRKRA